MSLEHEPISDWSRAGRAALVEARGAEIRLLLDTAFTEFCDQHTLAEFGFHGEDPIAEAVEWCVEQFVERELDPAQLSAGSASFRLFTEVRFWLSQKVGARAFAQRMLARPREVPALAAPEEEDPAPQLERLGMRLAKTLRELRHRTCEDLVGYWLRGTQRLRAYLFGWKEETPVRSPASSKTRVSAHVHDARFRFQCLHHGLVEETSNAPALAAVRETLFRPCENAVPYRRPTKQVAKALALGTTHGLRAVRQLCRDGSAILLGRLAAALVTVPDSGEARAEWLFTRQAVAPMTLSALDIDDREELRLQIRALPPLDALLREEP